MDWLARKLHVDAWWVAEEITHPFMDIPARRKFFSIVRQFLNKE